MRTRWKKTRAREEKVEHSSGTNYVEINVKGSIIPVQKLRANGSSIPEQSGNS